MARSIIVLVLLMYPRYCRDPVYFVKPQPDGVDNALAFPHTFRGAYLTVGFDSTSVDSHFVTIDNHRMNCRSIYLVTLHADSLRAIKDLRISSDTIYWLEPDIVSFSTFRLQGDSAVVRSVADRDLFVLTDSTMLRVLDNVCYLNFWDRETNAYHVELLEIDKDSLVHASIEMKKEEGVLRKSFHVRQEGPTLFVEANLQQMKSFVAAGGFRWEDKLAKLHR